MSAHHYEVEKGEKMKKITAILIAAIMLFAAVSCTGAPAETTGVQTTAAETTAAETTAAETTTAETTAAETAAETTAEETETVTTAAETTAEETTKEAVDTDPETTAETTAVTTEEQTTAPETTGKETTAAETAEPAADLYYYDRIYVTKPAGYTFKDFAGLPSGLKDGVQEGCCFFNFGVQSHVEPMTEATANDFLKGMASQIGDDYTMDGFSTFTVDGVTVTKLDYTWGNGGAIIQSLVKVYFDDGDVVIQFAVLSSMPEGVTEFNEMIKTLGIKY